MNVAVSCAVMVVLDYDVDERVVGIELLHLRKRLPDADPTRLEREPTPVSR